MQISKNAIPNRPKTVPSSICFATRFPAQTRKVKHKKFDSKHLFSKQLKTFPSGISFAKLCPAQTRKLKHLKFDSKHFFSKQQDFKNAKFWLQNKVQISKNAIPNPPKTFPSGISFAKLCPAQTRKLKHLKFYTTYFFHNLGKKYRSAYTLKN